MKKIVPGFSSELNLGNNPQPGEPGFDPNSNNLKPGNPDPGFDPGNPDDDIVCYEVTVVHISFHIKYKPARGRNWLIESEFSVDPLHSLVPYASIITNNKMGMTQNGVGNFYKFCACLSKSGLDWAPLATAVPFSPLQGLPFNKSAWMKRSDIVGYLNAGKGSFAKTVMGEELTIPEWIGGEWLRYQNERYPHKWNRSPVGGRFSHEGIERDQYVFTRFTEVCKCNPYASTTGCECKDFRNVSIIIDDKTTEWKSPTDGGVVKLTNPSKSLTTNRKNMIEQIVAHEANIPLNCKGS